MSKGEGKKKKKEGLALHKTFAVQGSIPFDTLLSMKAMSQDRYTTAPPS
jgi:hypothetical protein